ncbi:MAG: ABC transporter ATP-binding protein [Nitrospirota bacterium]
MDNSKNTEKVITVKNVSKQYRLYKNRYDRIHELLSFGLIKLHQKFLAVDNVSFEVFRGETIGIIGQNGSGKSTILKLICGISPPTKGDLRVSGKIASLLELGIGFSPNLTGRENVYLHGALMGYSRDEIKERAPLIEEFAGIGDYIDQPVKLYSSGMFVRLAFSCAVNVEPDILIVDEALAVGDTRFQRKCYAKFSEFRKNNKTILFVSHDMNTVSQLSDRVILLSEGRIIEQGNPKYVTNLYLKEALDIKPSARRDVQRIDGYHAPVVPVVDTSKPAENEQLKKAVIQKLNVPLNDLNSYRLQYGNNKAEIIDCGILNNNGERVTLLETGKDYTFFSRALFYEELEDIIMGCRIVNAKGVELFGANTLDHKIDIPSVNRGEVIEAQFHVIMWLATGKFFLTFGVWGPNFSVLYHRLADIIAFEVTAPVGKVPNAISLVSLDEWLEVKRIME